MAAEFHTQQGVLRMQARLIEIVRNFANEKRVELDPYGPEFFDGSMSLPERGAPWKMTLRSRGKSKDVVFKASDLEDLDTGRLSMVPKQIGMALNELRHLAMDSRDKRGTA